MSLEEIKGQLEDLDDILNQLHLADDRALQDKMSLAKIELEATMFKLPESTQGTSVPLTQIHLENLNSSLYKILESALGYYAIVDEAKGANEPLIGPSRARELLINLRDKKINLASLKDELHAALSKA